ncbi:MAG TPA: hypothetical protein PLD20_16570 [Blastocatellia bacterium]|nr:hypothetical protein [Blastocatellia bacterium]HMX27155.1 hypothetical protein [Blastocatellia bacterium]HMY73147.1 hypothetical protein [Blastocatellia bacterium]HMZ19552.1 hypothetical protein [Blastocatellia bacterium]HNG29131.1 hypothetical protein [Blastocatellia bacterium]
MKLPKRKLFIGMAVATFFLLLMAFPFGPLLPWSPIKPGYNSVSHARADVYFNKAEAEPADCRAVDQMMAEAEGFHGLKFQKRVKVIDCKNWDDCGRSWFWMNVKPLGGITLGTGDVIYLTPKIKERNFSLAEFLRHELSHALISQNTSIRNSLKLTDQAWFSEGIAVWFGNQKAYLSREEFLEKAKTADLVKVIDPAQMDRTSPDWSARFAYPAQRYFLEYLKQTRGADQFQSFLVKYIQAPDDYQTLFNEIYKQSLTDAVRQFEQAIRSGQWLPK